MKKTACKYVPLSQKLKYFLHYGNENWGHLNEQHDHIYAIMTASIFSFANPSSMLHFFLIHSVPKAMWDILYQHPVC